MARAATSPELALYRTPGKWSKLYAAIYSPATIYTARVNQTFTTNDQVLEITYDTGSGTLANVLPDMTMLVGTSAGAHDKGICRIRSADGSKFYISETSDISWANDLYLTVISDFGLWAKHVLITAGVSYMDGGIAYSDQHANFDPVPVMGSHRVLKLTGATVSTTFDFSDCYVIDGSAISTYATTSPTASGGADLTTDAPTLQWNTTGWHTVYLTLTAANGKSFFGVRYVYVWDDTHLPSSVILEGAGCDAETGGWDFSLTMLDNVTLSDVRDRALVIVFSEDHFGDTTSAIGPVAGSENILCLGWIAEESINWNPEQGQVRFKAYGAHYWFGQIPAFPDGVEFVSGTPAAWTEMQNLTVNLGLYHFLHWRTSATRIMDVLLTGDTKYSKEVSSLAGNLWEQLREMAGLQIYARPGVNAHGQLYVEVHPQLVPEASRTWPTVMTITTADWLEQIDFERVVKPEVSAVSLSGVAVNSSGVGTPYFSIAPGHAYPRYGSLEVQDNLLLASQSQANVLAGLYRSWRNNVYPEIPVQLDADIRLIDCFPRQKCAISISAGNTPRGITYTGNLIPTAIQISFDLETGYLRRDVTFEAETLEGLAATNTVPGEGDRSVPPIPPLPPLPPLPPIIPGVPGGSENGPSVAVMHDVNQGLLYSTNFDSSTPTWNFFNAGLTTTQKQLVNRFFMTLNGACYCAYAGTTSTNSSGAGFVARAPSLGGTWTVIYNASNLSSGSNRWGILAIAHNPLVSETVGIVIENGQDASSVKLYVGSNTSFTAGGAIVSPGELFNMYVSYGLGKWMVTGYDFVKLVSPDGSSVTTAPASASNQDRPHVRASTTGRTFHPPQSGNHLYVADNNYASRADTGATGVVFDDGFNSPVRFATDPSGTYCMTTWSGKGRSSDAGYTWAPIPNLPVGNWWFDYAGPTSRFVAAGGTTVRYSPDFGESWHNKEGNLTGLIAIPSINLVKVLEY